MIDENTTSSDTNEAMPLPDIQSQPDTRNIPLDRVGVKGLRWPITVLDRAIGSQQTIATVNMYVNPQRRPNTCRTRVTPKDPPPMTHDDPLQATPLNSSPMIPIYPQPMFSKTPQ